MPMLRPLTRRFAVSAVLLILCCVSAPVPSARAGEITSRMRSVSGVFEVNGYRIAPVYDVDIPPDYEDLTPPQAYEITRPSSDQALTIGRLFTSCSCIRLEATKRTFEPGERVILHLRNIRPTPANGQMYAFFIQLTGPMQATLRFDVFVQTGVRIGDTPPPPPAPGTADDAADPELAATPTTAGLNNQLAAALRAVNGHADTTPLELPPELGSEGEPDAATLEATGDILDAAGAESVESAADADAAESTENADSADNADSAAPAAPEPSAPPATPEPVALFLSTELGGDLPDFNTAAPQGADAARLDDDQILQLQRLALIQAEEQAKQLAARVQQLQTPPAAAPAPPPVAPAPRRAGPPSLADRPVQSVSLITIGSRDMPASIRFYEALGWQRAARGKYDQTAFFQLNGQVLALYPLADLLLEQNMKDAAPAPGGITLALHVQAKEDVSVVYRLFIDAGGTSLRPPAEMASGAVSSYVADPDGNPWEISWVPQFTLDPNGGLWLP